MMVVEEIIRSSPRQQAPPCIAEGFSPTARSAYGEHSAAAPVQGARGRSAPHMDFEEILRSRPRRRASPCLAEGFSPTARAVGADF